MKDKNLSMMGTYTLGDQTFLDQKVVDLHQVVEKVSKVVQLLKDLMDKHELVNLKTGDNRMVLQQVTRELVLNGYHNFVNGLKDNMLVV